MNPLTTPLIRLQQMHMDDVVLLTRETSTGLGAGLIKINYMQFLEQQDRGLHGCVFVCVCLFTCSDVDGDGRTVNEGLLLCSYCKVVESARSLSRKHCTLTENLLHL